MNADKSAPATPSLAISWSRPNFLLALFALPSLLGVTNSLAAALGLAATTAVAVCVSALLPWLLRRWVAVTLGPWLWLLLTATTVTVLELLLHAYFYDLWRIIGLFLPLSVTGCLLFVREEMHATHRRVLTLPWAVVKASSGFALPALVLGAAREWVGRGSLFHDAGALLGAWAAPLEFTFFRADMGFLLAALPPGAFIALGVGVAFYNWVWWVYRRFR